VIKNRLGIIYNIISFTVLKKAFDAFDQEKRGCISVNMVGTILSMLGHALTEGMLADVISEVDADRKLKFLKKIFQKKLKKKNYEKFLIC